MVKAKSAENIQTAITKLKTESSVKERELIDLISSIYDAVRDTEQKAVEKVVDTASAVNDSVHNSPWPFIGGAAIGGFVLGMFCRR